MHSAEGFFRYDVITKYSTLSLFSPILYVDMQSQNPIEMIASHINMKCL